jgi:hypothetical protein
MDAKILASKETLEGHLLEISSALERAPLTVETSGRTVFAKNCGPSSNSGGQCHSRRFASGGKPQESEGSAPIPQLLRDPASDRRPSRVEVNAAK